MPTNPAALMVMPDEVALKAPPGVILNLFASELSKPRNHSSVPASWNWMMGSPADVWLIVSVEVAVRVVADPGTWEKRWSIHSDPCQRVRLLPGLYRGSGM